MLKSQIGFSRNKPCCKDPYVLMYLGKASLENSMEMKDTGQGTEEAIQRCSVSKMFYRAKELGFHILVPDGHYLSWGER
jgi:hypothetical protein